MSYFVFGIRIVDPVIQVDIILNDLNVYDLKWNPVQAYPGEKLVYLVDYILTVQGKNGVRQKVETTDTLIPILYKGELLRPADVPSYIRGVITVRSQNGRDSSVRYFDLSFIQFIVPIRSKKSKL